MNKGLLLLSLCCMNVYGKEDLVISEKQFGDTRYQLTKSTNTGPTGMESHNYTIKKYDADAGEYKPFVGDSSGSFGYSENFTVDDQGRIVFAKVIMMNDRPWLVLTRYLPTGERQRSPEFRGGPMNEHPLAQPINLTTVEVQKGKIFVAGDSENKRVRMSARFNEDGTEDKDYRIKYTPRNQ